MTDLAGTCLHLIASGVSQLRDDPRTAFRAFASVLVATHAMPPAEGGLELHALALYNVSRLRLREERLEESRQLREQATEFLARSGGSATLAPSLRPVFDELMADVLTELGEYRRALPYCEASIQNFTELSDGVAATAGVMWRAGTCYAKMGLRDHAAIPLRAAVKYFRMLTGDPRLPAALLDLGNVLRKSSPGKRNGAFRKQRTITSPNSNWHRQLRPG